MRPFGWEAKFNDPIPVSTGKPLATLRDAARYITKLSKTDQHASEWQTAMHCLIEAADNGGPIAFARMGVMRGLNRHAERVFDSSRKDTHHWGRRKLARDQ